MKKLDLYIIRRFLVTYFFMLLVIMSVAIVFDLAENLDRFMNIPWEEVFRDHYVNFFLLYSNRFSALIVFLSALLFTARMARDTEIVPILSGGVSFRRLLVPYFLAATLITVYSLYMNHYAIPKANEVRLAFDDRYDGNRFFRENVHEEHGKGQTVHFKQYFESVGHIQEFLITNRDVQTGRLKSILYAAQAKGDTLSNRWTLSTVKIRSFGEDGTNHVFRSMPQLDTSLSFSMAEFTADEEISSTMPTPELRAFIVRQEEKGVGNIEFYEVKLHERTSYPLATYILVLLAVSLASRKTRNSIGLNFALGIFLTLVYIFSMQMSTTASIKVGFSPFWAVWLPNIGFLLVTLYIYKRAPK